LAGLTDSSQPEKSVNLANPRSSQLEEKPMPQEFQIIFDPALALRGEAFTAAWNQAEKTAPIARAALDPARPSTFFDLEAVNVVLTVAVSVTGGILSNLLTDLLKEKFGLNNTESQTIERPDGKTIIIVKKG
jgi:hypothetical protein